MNTNKFLNNVSQADAEIILDFLRNVQTRTNVYSDCQAYEYFAHLILNYKDFTYFVKIVECKSCKSFKVYGKQIPEFCARISNMLGHANINMYDEADF